MSPASTDHLSIKKVARRAPCHVCLFGCNFQNFDAVEIQNLLHILLCAFLIGLSVPFLRRCQMFRSKKTKSLRTTYACALVFSCYSLINDEHIAEANFTVFIVLVFSLLPKASLYSRSWIMNCSKGNYLISMSQKISDITREMYVGKTLTISKSKVFEELKLLFCSFRVIITWQTITFTTIKLHKPKKDL